MPPRPSPPTRLVAALLLLVAVSAPDHASAQVPDSPSRTLYAQAYDAMARNDYLGARNLLLTLWSRAKTHDVAASLGQVEYKLGHTAEAARYMTLAISLVPPQEPASTTEKYQSGLDELKKAVATFHVTLKPADAELTLDGKPVQLSGSDLFAEPGTHVLAAAAAEFEPTRLDLDAKAGKAETVELTLEPRAATAGPATKPTGADRSAHVTPPPPVDVAPKDARRDWTVPAIFGGVFAASTVATVWLRFAASSDEQDVERLQRAVYAKGPAPCSSAMPTPDCGSLRDTIQRHNREADWANATLVISGVAAVGAVVAYELTGPSRTAHVSASLGVTRSGAAAFLQGSF